MRRVIFLDYRRVMNDNDRRAEHSRDGLHEQRPA